MKRLVLVLLLTTGLAGASQAADDAHSSAAADMRPVDHIHVLNRIDSWRPIDRDSLIIWATPFRPYLVELSRPSIGMRFEQAIGVTSTAGTVYAKFDDVIVDGMRYPIRAIYELDRQTARHMKKSA